MTRTSQRQSCESESNTLSSLTGLMHSTTVNHPTSFHTKHPAYYMEPNNTVRHDRQSTSSKNYDINVMKLDCHHIGAQFLHSPQAGYNTIENTPCHTSGNATTVDNHCNCAARNSPLQSPSNSRLTVENLATHEGLMHHNPAGKFDDSIRGVLAAAKCLQFADDIKIAVKIGEPGKLPITRWAESPEEPFSKTVVRQG